MARARELTALIRAGAVDGLSIGFRTVRARVDPASRVRKLIDVDLWEISIVTFPLLNGARVTAVKDLAAGRDERLFRRRPRLSFARTPAPRKFGQALQLVGQKYSPSQPRVPAGNPDGGRWTSGARAVGNAGVAAAGDAPRDGRSLAQELRRYTASDQPPRPDRQQLEAIANDPLIRAYMDEAWIASNPYGIYPNEHGFWISRDEVSGQLFTRPFAAPGVGNMIYVGSPPPDAIAFFHTHPYGRIQLGAAPPSLDDEALAAGLRLPGLIQSHVGMYYFGPPLRPVR